MPKKRGRWKMPGQALRRAMSEKRLVRSAVKAGAVRGLYAVILRTPEGRKIKEGHDIGKLDRYLMKNIGGHAEVARRGHIGRHSVLEPLPIGRKPTHRELGLRSAGEARRRKIERTVLNLPDGTTRHLNIGVYEQILDAVLNDRMEIGLLTAEVRKLLMSEPQIQKKFAKKRP